jgi:hypothetical protein
MFDGCTFSETHLHPVMASLPGFAQENEGREEEHTQRHENAEDYEPETNLLYEVGARRKSHDRNDDK